MTLHVQPRRSPVADTYNAAADHFDAAPLDFWRRHGRRAVVLAALGPGDTVLDVGCGTGASAIPAAETVGPLGHVLGIDLAEAMIIRARFNAADRGFANLHFRVGEMERTGEPDGRFDAVIGVFSIFFVADMPTQLAELWRLLKPGGRLVMTAWADGAFQPAAQHFNEELRRFGPGVEIRDRPWDRLTDPHALAALIEDATGTAPQITTIEDHERLVTPADWWTIAMGSGFRGEIERLDRMERQTLRERIMDRLWQHGVRRIGVSAHHAVATKRF